MLTIKVVWFGFDCLRILRSISRCNARWLRMWATVVLIRLSVVILLTSLGNWLLLQRIAQIIGQSGDSCLARALILFQIECCRRRIIEIVRWIFVPLTLFEQCISEPVFDHLKENANAKTFQQNEIKWEKKKKYNGTVRYKIKKSKLKIVLYSHDNTFIVHP